MNVESIFLVDRIKFETFKEFIMRKLDYVFKMILVHKKCAKLLDYHIRSFVKNTQKCLENNTRETGNAVTGKKRRSRGRGSKTSAPQPT